jgi:MFS superfamily sulfate permease-like transporter
MQYQGTKNLYSFQNVLQNTIAGFTVSFVALSLGATFGILSGRGAFTGMLSAAIIAFITSACGGTVRDPQPVPETEAFTKED